MALLNRALEIYSLAVTMILLFWNYWDRKSQDRQNILLHEMLVCNAVLIASFLIVGFMNDHPGFHALHVFAVAVSFSFAFPLAGIYDEFVVEVINENLPAGQKANVKITNLVRSLCIIAVILNFVSMFNGMYFYIDSAGTYFRGSLFWLNQAFCIIIIIPIMIRILMHQKDLKQSNVLILISYTILPLIAAAIQFPYPEFDTMCFATTLSLLIVVVTLFSQRSKELVMREKDLSEMRIDVMLSQIQPHFLYNTLAVIQDMCHGKAPEAEEALIQFSEFLRGNMDSLNNRRLISFEQELKHTQNYLSLEEKRFGDRLRVSYDIQTRQFSLPSLTLQPIVENAVRYGVTQKEEGGTVKITTRKTENGVQVIVEDDGVGIDIMKPKNDGRTHIGITNVKTRLAQMCNGTLEIKSVLGSGTRAVLYIPDQGDDKK